MLGLSKALRTNVVYLDDFVVPVENRLGEKGDGFTIAVRRPPSRPQPPPKPPPGRRGQGTRRTADRRHHPMSAQHLHAVVHDNRGFYALMVVPSPPTGLSRSKRSRPADVTGRPDVQRERVLSGSKGEGVGTERSTERGTA